MSSQTLGERDCQLNLGFVVESNTQSQGGTRGGKFTWFVVRVMLTHMKSNTHLGSLAFGGWRLSGGQRLAARALKGLERESREEAW